MPLSFADAVTMALDLGLDSADDVAAELHMPLDAARRVAEAARDDRDYYSNRRAVRS